MPIEDDVLALLEFLLARADVPARVRLGDAQRLLAKFRAETLDAELAARCGDRVRRGPFEGMRFPAGWTQACYAPKLLGTYESELHGIVESLSGRAYRAVINAGCAEGYYAVGLARRLPGARVIAFDTEPRARERCRALARLNGVEDRVEVRCTVDHAALRGHAAPTLLVCDIEGAERALLDPGMAPALASMDLLVEVHDVFAAGTGEALRARFSGSHRIRRIASGECGAPALPELLDRDQLDQLLARWEGRLAGTYWLWMEAARPGGAPG